MRDSSTFLSCYWTLKTIPVLGGMLLWGCILMDQVDWPILLGELVWAFVESWFCCLSMPVFWSMKGYAISKSIYTLLVLVSGSIWFAVMSSYCTTELILILWQLSMLFMASKLPWGSFKGQCEGWSLWKDGWLRILTTLMTRYSYKW